MKLFSCVLAILVGGLFCLVGDYEAQHSWVGQGIDIDSWNFLGSLIIGGGMAAFVVQFWRKE